MHPQQHTINQTHCSSRMPSNQQLLGD